MVLIIECSSVLFSVNMLGAMSDANNNTLANQPTNKTTPNPAPLH